MQDAKSSSLASPDASERSFDAAALGDDSEWSVLSPKPASSAPAASAFSSAAAAPSAAAARRARGLKREVFTWPLFADTPLVPSFILMFGVALVSAAIGLAAIIGAFVAGLIVAETEAQDELEHERSL